MDQLSLDVVVTRGAVVESRHRVHAAVVNASSNLVASAHDADLVTYWRSCAKPFQVMPLIESGGFDQIKWGDDELALACASHGGEPEHVEIVGRMLASIGMEEGDLACGPHEPLSPRGAKIARECGARIKRTHNNCSGKHTAMLAFALHKNWSIEGYERATHEVQQTMLNQVALWTGLRASDIEVAIDGCGAAVFGMPLEAMARAYARLASAAMRGEEIPARVTKAMGNHPFLVGGTERLDSIIIEETNGRVLTKVGAEGVHSALILDQGIGLALKVEDGSPRAQQPALIRLLQELDALPDPLPARLAELVSRPVKNSRGEVVGETYVKSSMRAHAVDAIEVASI
jgi:L-asparaginase II